MLRHKRHGFKIAFFAVLTAVLFIAGCAEKKRAEKIIAVINGYEMTVEDFNYESKEALRSGRMFDDIPVTREDVLEALITKEILLQEAQKENLDKNKDFIRAIELYWEQTLLKNLLVGKARQIAGKTVAYEDEINDYYNKMKTMVKAAVFVFADEKAARRAFGHKGDISEYARQKPEKISLAYTLPSKWYILEESYSPLVYSIFAIDKDDGKGLIKINDKWGFVAIEERAPNEVEPLSVLREEVADSVKKKKEKESMDEWIDILRSKANVRINQKVFNALR